MGEEIREEVGEKDNRPKRMGEASARVKTIFVYPIKSCRGISVAQAPVSPTGNFLSIFIINIHEGLHWIVYQVVENHKLRIGIFLISTL